MFGYTKMTHPQFKKVISHQIFETHETPSVTNVSCQDQDDTTEQNIDMPVLEKSYNIIGRRVYIARRFRGLTQRKVAQLLETSVPKLSYFEKSTTTISGQHTGNLVTGLGVPLSYLTGDAPEDFNMTNEPFSAQMRYYRAKHNLTQCDVSSHCEISLPTISHWETDDSITSIKAVYKQTLAKLFEIDPAELNISDTKKSNRHYIGNQLKELRKKSNLTQTELSEGLHTNQANIFRWENNKNSVSDDQLTRICELFGVSPSHFHEETVAK